MRRTTLRATRSLQGSWTCRYSAHLRTRVYARRKPCVFRYSNKLSYFVILILHFNLNHIKFRYSKKRRVFYELLIKNTPKSLFSYLSHLAYFDA